MAEELPPAPGDTEPAGGNNVSQQVAIAMLSYAYPGVGLAAQALTSFNNFNDAIDRAQRLSAILRFAHQAGFPVGIGFNRQTSQQPPIAVQ